MLLPNHEKLGKPGKPILLIMDGYSSHTGDSRIDLDTFCTGNRIVIITLPPHTTHILQPLDVGIPNVFEANLRSPMNHQVLKCLENEEGLRLAMKKIAIAQAKSIAACTFSMRPQIILGSFIKTDICPPPIITFLYRILSLREVPQYAREAAEAYHKSIIALRLNSLVPRRRTNIEGKVTIFG